MIKLIGHHACRNTGNALHIEKSGLPAAISTYNPTNSKNPFLGSGYYFGDYNIRMAKYWGKSHYNNKYYIFQADIPYDENTLLDLVGNRQHIEWLVDLMDDFKDANEGNAHWNIGTFIEFLKEIAEEDEYSDIFPFKSIRAIDHSASIPNVEYYFDGQSKAYITLNPRIIICIIDANPLTLQNLKLILSKMNNLNKSRELLKKYFRETPKEVLNQKIEKFNQAPFDGPSVAQYLSMFASHYTFFDNTIPSKKFTTTTVQAKWTELVFSNEKNEKIISNISNTHIKTDSRAEFDNYNFFALAA